MVRPWRVRAPRNASRLFPLKPRTTLLCSKSSEMDTGTQETLLTVPRTRDYRITLWQLRRPGLETPKGGVFCALSTCCVPSTTESVEERPTDTACEQGPAPPSTDPGLMDRKAQAMKSLSLLLGTNGRSNPLSTDGSQAFRVRTVCKHFTDRGVHLFICHLPF